MIVPDGLIWQIGAMVLFRLIFVVFSKYDCIENAIFGSLIYGVYLLKDLIMFMAFIHTQNILWKSGKQNFLMVLGIAVVGVYQVANIKCGVKP